VLTQRLEKFSLLFCEAMVKDIRGETDVAVGGV
jgi:hypothetical protein